MFNYTLVFNKLSEHRLLSYLGYNACVVHLVVAVKYVPA